MNAYERSQKLWIEKHGFKVGDKVKVLRKAEDFEDGWSTFWCSEQDKTIGKVYQIESFVNNRSVRLYVGYFVVHYPYFVLEPVKAQTPKRKTPIPQKSKYASYNKTMTLKEIREFFR